MHAGGRRSEISSIASCVNFFQDVSIARFFVLLGLILLPTSALADGGFLSRRDGFLLLWESISRPAFETNAKYEDLQEGEQGFSEISYAKRRGILPDSDTFRSNEPLLLRDALLWLYRTRNVRELPDMAEVNLQGMMRDYPVASSDIDLNSRVTSQELIDDIRTLDQLLAKQVHAVSFYSDDFHGNGTAFGETFDMNAVTAAHRSFPHNTLVKVTNLENTESVIVRINDRGPYVHGRDMDLSLAAFQKIAHTGQGVLQASFERLGDADMVDTCLQQQRQYQRRITKDVRFFRGIPHTFTLGDQLVIQSNKPFVVQRITFPDGLTLRVQDFVLPKEKYRFTPNETGRYILHMGDTLGSTRELRMNVSNCQIPG